MGVHCVEQGGGQESAARSIMAQLKFNIYHEKIKLSQEMNPSLQSWGPLAAFLDKCLDTSLLNINVQRSHDLFVSPHTIWPQNSLPPRKFLFHSLLLSGCGGQGLYERLTIFSFTRICMSFQFRGTKLDCCADTNYRGLVLGHFRISWWSFSIGHWARLITWPMVSKYVKTLTSSSE